MTRYILELRTNESPVPDFHGPYPTLDAAEVAQGKWEAELIAQEYQASEVLVHVLHDPQGDQL